MLTPVVLCCSGLVLAALTLLLARQGCNLLGTLLVNGFSTAVLCCLLLLALYLNGFNEVCQVWLVGEPLCQVVDQARPAGEVQP